MMVPIPALLWLVIVDSRGSLPLAVLAFQVVSAVAMVLLGIHIVRRAHRVGLYIDGDRVVIENWASRTETSRDQVAEVVAGRIVYPPWPQAVLVFLVLKDGRQLRVDGLGAFRHVKRLGPVVDEIEATLGLVPGRSLQTASGDSTTG